MEQNLAEVADEEAEQSKHFDEEAASGGRSDLDNYKRLGSGNSRRGDNSKQLDFGSTSLAGKEGATGK